MKKRSIAVTISLLILFAMVMVAGAQVNSGSRGTIRGAVYIDVDGDGQCINTGVSGENPAPNIDIFFTNGLNRITLFTGSNGTYGLAAAGRGQWIVTANPNIAWRVTSPNPLFVNVSPQAGLVQTNINFCVQPTGLVPPGIGPASQTAVSPTPSIANLAATSQALLTNPPQTTPEPVSESQNAEEATRTVEEFAGQPADWLGYLNGFREMGGAPALANSEALSLGSFQHSKYMVVNDRPIAHNEDKTFPLFTPAGQQAAINGNLFATTQVEANYVWAINFWASAPFHLLPMMDPALRSTGFGVYNQEIGQFHMAAVLDIRSELGEDTGDVQFPLFFPGDNTETWIVRHSLYEWPDPLASCPGFTRPAGPPLVVQLGDGSLTPNVTNHAVFIGDRRIDSCRFTETTYTNPDAYAQGVGRTILGDRDAVVIIPRQPLAVGETYTVQVEANGELYTWRFSTRRGP